jgi:hypothetical protein
MSQRFSSELMLHAWVAVANFPHSHPALVCAQ